MFSGTTETYLAGGSLSRFPCQTSFLCVSPHFGVREQRPRPRTSSTLCVTATREKEALVHSHILKILVKRMLGF